MAKRGTKRGMDPNTMDLAACRDWIARDEGWISSGRGWWRDADKFPGQVQNYHSDPVPPTLDAAASAMPEGWYTKLYINQHGVTIAHGMRDDAVFERTADSELLARFRLAVACRMAAKENK